MNRDYIIAHPWSIIEEGFDPGNVEASESLFSIGNGAMGQRANFEETYSGKSLQGSYIGGVYYPDKTKVGWWKVGYPEYFAKVLNAPNWIGIRVRIDGEELDISKALEIRAFKRELNMLEGWYSRRCEIRWKEDLTIELESIRFLSMEYDEFGAIRYSIRMLKGDAEIELEPYIDGAIRNSDSSWDERFWDTLDSRVEEDIIFLHSKTRKTNFEVCTLSKTELSANGASDQAPEAQSGADEASLTYNVRLSEGRTAVITKYGGYVTSFNHDRSDLAATAAERLKNFSEIGFDALLDAHSDHWRKVWEMADIKIEGDLKAQQGIRYNIFQLHQTYNGKDPRLNIGPKGFTGEKYGGSTYWDTEAYCLPFYMATMKHDVARNLLLYRYKHLPKAIENAEKLGFSGGAALYPMVTMNGEECHNEWEITFEEIHRNAAIVYAIYNYTRYTGDEDYILEYGLEVMIAVARFWAQRVNWSEEKKAYVILGVTGPNEYENNVNNNWYTNFMARWCLQYCLSQLDKHRDEGKLKELKLKLNLKDVELSRWTEIRDKMYLHYDEGKGIFWQQDGFFDKEIVPVKELDQKHRPLYKKWSWDRVLRSCYIKQADVLQGIYFFRDQFDKESIAANFDFYESICVHESSLSPCVHVILAAGLGMKEKAHELFLRTSRLDLDDYNQEVEEGCHITSMAGTWLSVVEGFGGMEVVENRLSFNPVLPEAWDSLSFKINYRGSILEVNIQKDSVSIKSNSLENLEVLLNGELVAVNRIQNQVTV